MNFQSPEYSQSLAIVNRLIATSELKEDDESLVNNELGGKARKGDATASTLMALFYMLNSDIKLCDEWTLYAGSLGAREIWVNEQIENPWFGYLAVRLDALNSLDDEKTNLAETSMSLQFHLFHKISNESFYYSVKCIVHILRLLGELKAFEFFCGLLRQNIQNIGAENEQLIAISFSSATSPYFYSKIFEEVFS